jgi:hypothetical protein
MDKKNLTKYSTIMMVDRLGEYFSRQLLNSRIQIEQLRHDQVDGIFPVLKITLP